MEVYQDVKEIEQNLSKSLNIASKYPINMIHYYRFHDTKEELSFPGTYRNLGGSGSYWGRKVDCRAANVDQRRWE